MTKVTYGQLDKVLRALGFSVRLVSTEKKLRVYEHEHTGARMPFAYLADDQNVLPHHLAIVRAVLDEYKIADSLDFVAELQKAC